MWLCGCNIKTMHCNDESSQRHKNKKQSEVGGSSEWETSMSAAFFLTSMPASSPIPIDLSHSQPQAPLPAGFPVFETLH